MGPPPPPRAGAKKPEAVLPLKSPEELEHWVQDRDKTLLVIDVHPDWSGSCAEVLESFCRKTALDINNGAADSHASARGAGEEKEGGSGEDGDGGSGSSTGTGSSGPAGPALQFLTANRQTLGSKLRALFFPGSQQQGSSPPAPAAATKSAAPASGAGAGAAPALASHFTMDDGGESKGSGDGAAAALAALLDSGGCQPLFLLAKGRQLVGAVRGVKTPTLQQMIGQHAGRGGNGGGPGAA